MIEIAVTLLLLHAPDGSELHINPSHVTSLRARPPAGDSTRMFDSDVQCLVNLGDGKFVTVVEPCHVVRQMLEDAK